MAKILHLINNKQKIKLELVNESIHFYIQHLSEYNTNTDKILDLKRIIREIETLYQTTKSK